MRVRCQFQGEGKVLEQKHDQVLVRFEQKVDKNGNITPVAHECWRSLSYGWLTVVPEKKVTS